MPSRKPIICITMGDGAGVGPEIIVKALADKEIYERCNPLVIGDANRLELVKELLRAEVDIAAINHVEEAVFHFKRIVCLDLNLLPQDLPFGRVSATAGHAAFSYIEKAIQLGKEGKVDAICTAPINKEALHKGGHIFPGHTEILAQLTNTEDYAMMLVAPNLKVIHVTTHLGLIDAILSITPERVYQVIRLANQTLKKAGFTNPRIAVCGINPHAGENGLFGNGEEAEKIQPAIARARKEGIIVTDPLPADTLFFRAVRGDFDIVVAMYHDQGHGPIKVLGLDTGVNITVGLSIIRTSVDHGTAFDIAGKGVAEEHSLKEAIKQAIDLAPI